MVTAAVLGAPGAVGPVACGAACPHPIAPKPIAVNRTDVAATRFRLIWCNLVESERWNRELRTVSLMRPVP